MPAVCHIMEGEYEPMPLLPTGRKALHVSVILMVLAVPVMALIQERTTEAGGSLTPYLQMGFAGVALWLMDRRQTASDSRYEQLFKRMETCIDETSKTVAGTGKALEAIAEILRSHGRH